MAGGILHVWVIYTLCNLLYMRMLDYLCRLHACHVRQFVQLAKLKLNVAVKHPHFCCVQHCCRDTHRLGLRQGAFLSAQSLQEAYFVAEFRLMQEDYSVWLN